MQPVWHLPFRFESRYHAQYRSNKTMASVAIHIPNTKVAIESGTIPGEFSEDRTTFKFPTLAYVGARGATHLWEIKVRLIGDGNYVPITDEMLDSPAPELNGLKAEITVESQQVGGKVRDAIPTYVSSGKNLGKKNATNCITQAIRDALGLFNKQKKRADIMPANSDAAAASSTAVSAAAAAASSAAAAAASSAVAEEFDLLPPPMLVKKIGESREATFTPEVFASGVTVQRKLNGVHYVVYAGGPNCLTRYSRTGTEYPGQDQIVSEMLPMFAAAPRIKPGEFGTPVMPSDGSKLSERDRRILNAYGALHADEDDPTPYFDGELYLHGKSLNWISGQARKEGDEGNLEYHIFDVFFPHAKAAGHDMESRHRQAYIDAFFANAKKLPHPHVVRVENFPVKNEEEMNALAKQFLKDGYEGAIARKDSAGYRYGYSNYHSANLVKIKPVLDDEFTVVGYTQGTRGKDVGAVIWECEVPNPIDPQDKTFTVVPKDMTYEERYALFKCLNQKVDGPNGTKISRFERDIKGLPLTVEYREMSTKTGKPLQAKALAFRTYESGPSTDPVRALLSECFKGKK